MHLPGTSAKAPVRLAEALPAAREGCLAAVKSAMQLNNFFRFPAPARSFSGWAPAFPTEFQ
jgi:hypothetical protein